MGNIIRNTVEGDFLTPIQGVFLDQNFQTNLNNAIAKINDNFSKIISLPFLQGEKGDSVVDVDICLNDNANLKESILFSIYGQPQVNDDNFGGAVNGVSSWCEDDNNRTVKFYRSKLFNEDDTEEYFYISSGLYIFIDSRISVLSSTVNENISSFKDLSCALVITGSAPINSTTGVPEDINFKASKYNIIPTLYYNEESKYWCWKINDTDTGIIAQGVKGDPGKDAYVIIAQGKKLANQNESEQNIIKISGILQPLELSEETDIINAIPEGTLLGVWFDDNTEDDNSSNNNFAFGIAQHTEEYVYINLSTNDNINIDFASIINNLSLYKELNDIIYPNNENGDQLTLTGVYVPNNKILDDNATDSYVHMFWSNGGEVSGKIDANLGSVPAKCRTRGDANGDTNVLLPKYNNDNIKDLTSESNNVVGDSTISIWYPFIRAHHLAVIKGYQKDIGSIRLYNLKSTNPTQKDVSIDSGSSVVIESTQGEIVSLNDKGLCLDIKNKNDNPIIYMNHGDDENYSYITNGSMNIYKSKIYIGDENVESNLSSDFGRKNSNDRWKLTRSGIKLTNSDVILHAGELITSSSNTFKSVSVKDNSIQFDYKLTENLGPFLEGKVLEETRPRKLEHIALKLGGYNTIYNSITTNGDANTDKGKLKSFLLDGSKPLYLKSNENREYSLLSGKISNTAVLENWNSSPFEIENPRGEQDGKWGLITSYNALWTKIGNVVDVKGKIFLNTAKYTIGDNNTINILGGNDAVKPITYYQFFKFITAGNKLGFPFPVVIDNSNDNTRFYKVSTGNILDNNESSLVNKNSIGDINSDDFHIKSSNIYHNDILNGNAIFNFYGAAHNETDGNKLLDIIDINKNVFSVSAGIGRNFNYDDRYWGFINIPDYDIKGYIGDDAAINQGDLESEVNGPIKIASFDNNTDGIYSSKQNLYNRIISDNSHYQITTNIGPYYIRYITFSFSYVLDDDISLEYEFKNNNTYPLDNIASIDYSGSVSTNTPSIPSNPSTPGTQITPGTPSVLPEYDVPSTDSESLG